jgi:hypothetical protein
MNERLNGLPPAAKKENFMSNEPMDLPPSNGQIQPKAFHYAVKIDGFSDPWNVTVIALNGTSARAGLAQQAAFAGKTITYLGVSNHIIQVNE